MITSDEGLTNLIGAMFRLVAQDIRFGGPVAKKDALEFLESEWYKELCDMMDLNPKKLKKSIIHNKVAWRNRYE